MIRSANNSKSRKPSIV